MARRIPLGELCISKVATLPNGFDDIIDYIDISSVDNESKAIVAHQEIEGTEAPSRARQLLEVGDVLVSTVRPNLNAVAYVETAYKHTLVGSTGYCVLRTKKGVDNRFVFYFCQSPYFIEDMTAQATGASYPAVTASIVRNATVPDYSLEKGKVTNLYLKHWMRDDFFAEQVAQKVVGGGQPNLNTGWLKEFKIIIPPMSLQNEFTTFIEQVDKSKFAVQQSIEKLETLKKSLMQQYFG